VEAVMDDIGVEKLFDDYGAINSVMIQNLLRLEIINLSSLRYGPRLQFRHWPPV
jgi:hypothetical protein